MNVQCRNNVKIHSDAPVTMLFAHGFGCDQTMWRFIAPAFHGCYKVVTFDLVGSGGSDNSAYDRQKYASLQGHADDLLEIIDTVATGPVIFIGHSVSATIGLLASIRAPQRFAAQVMIGPSPCYINDGDYIGGFSHADIDDLLETMDSNYLGWSSSMAPVIMGAPDQPALRAELEKRFCLNDPDIARHFAKVTFLSDHRADVPLSLTTTLILQSSDDLIAPIQVGEFMHRNMTGSELLIIDNVGHCPHMSAPGPSSEAIGSFLSRLPG